MSEYCHVRTTVNATLKLFQKTSSSEINVQRTVNVSPSLVDVSHMDLFLTQLRAGDSESDAKILNYS